MVMITEFLLNNTYTKWGFTKEITGNNVFLLIHKYEFYVDYAFILTYSFVDSLHTQPKITGDGCCPCGYKYFVFLRSHPF